MSCCNSNDNCACNQTSSCKQSCGSSSINYIIILVLYILLAIIIGTTICY